MKKSIHLHVWGFFCGVYFRYGQCLYDHHPVENTTKHCGNGITEPGEECDCGGPVECNKQSDRCCDPYTCKLSNNATCSPCTDIIQFRGRLLCQVMDKQDLKSHYHRKLNNCVYAVGNKTNDTFPGLVKDGKNSLEISIFILSQNLRHY